MNAAVHEKLTELSTKYKTLQTDLAGYIQTGAQLAAQETENRIVMDEFEDLEGDAVIYKLVGPVLMRQDLQESKQTMLTRLKFIDQEKKRVETLVEKGRKTMEEKAAEIGRLQQKLEEAASRSPPP